MKKIIKLIPSNILRHLSHLYIIRENNKLMKHDKKRVLKFGITQNKNKWTYENLEAQITKVYHSVEKGLAYRDLRLGFGKNNIELLIELLKIYENQGYSKDNESYRYAISTLMEYIKVHKNSKLDIDYVKDFISYNKIEKNDNLGGVNYFSKSDILGDSKGDFKRFSISRHSIRDFSSDPVEMNLINSSIKLAQNTPSACNRQAWSVIVIDDEKKKELIRNNQNGNRGFGDKFDKIIVVTSNTKYFYIGPERNQAYIDGGMYAMNLLYSLHYYNIAAVPLSASLSSKQEKNIREGLSIKNSEALIMFIGIGNYLEDFKVPKSKRREPKLSFI